MRGERLAGTAVLLWLALLSGCGAKNKSAEKPADRIPDTVLAKSKLPGARGVGAAMRLQDSAAARRAREDSISRVSP